MQKYLYFFILFMNIHHNQAYSSTPEDLPLEFNPRIVPKYDPKKNQLTIVAYKTKNFGIIKLVDQITHEYYAKLACDTIDNILELSFIQDEQQIIYTPSTVTRKLLTGEIIDTVNHRYSQNKLNFIWHMIQLNHVTTTNNFHRVLLIGNLTEQPNFTAVFTELNNEEKKIYKQILKCHENYLQTMIKFPDEQIDCPTAHYKSRFKNT